MNDNDMKNLCHEIIGAAFEVRRHLGRFLYENIYEQALQAELKSRGIRSERQVYMPAFYKGMMLDQSFRVDLLVENSVPIELKTLDWMGTAELQQIMSYLVFGNFRLGYLMNFKADDFRPSRLPENMHMENGIYRLLNSKYDGTRPSLRNVHDKS